MHALWNIWKKINWNFSKLDGNLMRLKLLYTYCTKERSVLIFCDEIIARLRNSLANLILPHFWVFPAKLNATAKRA